jgi:hypothetical protein
VPEVVKLEEWRKYRRWSKEVNPRVDVGLAFTKERKRPALAVHFIKRCNSRPYLLGNIFSDSEEGFTKEELQGKVIDLLNNP